MYYSNVSGSNFITSGKPSVSVSVSQKYADNMNTVDQKSFEINGCTLISREVRHLKIKYL